MTTRPDSTFYASPKLAMEAPQENFAYTLLLSPDFSKPDALAVIDVRPGSPTFSQIVHTVTMPHKGNEFHHFGWNACSSSLSPLTGHAFLERRYLIIPGLRSSRIYIVDTKPDPTKATIHKIIEPEEVFKKTGYSRPHTVHCGPEGIYVSTLERPIELSSIEFAGEQGILLTVGGRPLFGIAPGDVDREQIADLASLSEDAKSRLAEALTAGSSKKNGRCCSAGPDSRSSD